MEAEIFGYPSRVPIIQKEQNLPETEETIGTGYVDNSEPQAQPVIHVRLPKIIIERPQKPDAWSVRLIRPKVGETFRIIGQFKGTESVTISHLSGAKIWISPTPNESGVGAPISAGGELVLNNTAEAWAFVDVGTSPEIVILREFYKQQT